MRIIFLLIIIVFVNIHVFAQIIFEHTYPYINSSSKNRVQLADIGGNDYKFIYSDYLSNELKLFNIDHTPFLTIPVPVALISQAEYTIGYVTKTLFDCDSSMIEYAIMAATPRNNFYIYRQDGTILFQRDSTIAPYGYGVFSGSYIERPVVNTPFGTKLFLAKLDNTIANYPTVDVYSLCGTLPQDANEINDADSKSVTISPNPANDELFFNFNSNFINLDLHIYNSTGQCIMNEINLRNISNFKLDTSMLTSGTYFFTLSSENKIIQSGSFVKSK